MEAELIKVAVASFVSGITGAMVGSVVMVVSMRVDIRWLKEQNRILHSRIDKTKEELHATIAAVRKRLENTRDMVLKHLP